MSLIGTVLRSPRPLIARIETALYILMPVWQSIIGISMLVAAYLLITGQANIFDSNAIYQIAFFYILGFGGVIMGCIAAGAPRGWKGYVSGFFIAQIYAFYTWLIWPVLLRSMFRQLTDQRAWAKTDREALEAPAPTTDPRRRLAASDALRAETQEPTGFLGVCARKPLASSWFC